MTAAPAVSSAAVATSAAHRVLSMDLTFVGAGASTAFVLLALLDGLADQSRHDPLRIAVVERDSRPFSGVPYGRRASRTCLLITNLHDFLPDAERRLFMSWLAERKDTAFNEFRAVGGPFSTLWWSRHQAAIRRDDFEDLFLPRYVFGDYLAERVGAAINRAQRAGVATVDLIEDEVQSVTVTEGGYLLDCRAGAFRTSRVVLATGSAPVRPRLRGEDPDGMPVLVDDPFEDMDDAVSRIGDGLRRVQPGRAPAVLLIGANASSMDLLYQINDRLGAEAEDCSFIVLSPRGQLPERMEAVTAGSTFTPERLHALADSDAVVAAEIYSAALADIAAGQLSGRSVADTLQPISEAVGRLVPRLNRKQAAEFAGRWGSELGRHQRRAGAEYCEVVTRLTAQGRLRVVAGSFLELRRSAGNATVVFDRAGTTHSLDQPIDVIVNCGGSVRSLEDAADFLPTRLLKAGLCSPTPYGVGIAVDSQLRAAPGLWVIGPLLAGNVIDGRPIWHMEHCGRITEYGTVLGRQIAQWTVDGAVTSLSAKLAVG